MKAIDKLLNSQKETDSLLCIGLDPVIEKMPRGINKDAKGIAEFCLQIIEKTKDIACAYKVNTAFFEQYGSAGVVAMEFVFESMPKNRFIIADAKRGDIGNTSRAYAKSVFEVINADAVTVSPYMGEDSIMPFLDYEDKMIFVLALTSNKGSGDFQKLEYNKKPLYLSVIDTVQKWERKADIGFVAGATHAGEIKTIREHTDHTLLIPGIGAQGGDAAAVLEANAGKPAIINSSRSIIFASDQENFANAARKKAEEFRLMLNGG